MEQVHQPIFCIEMKTFSAETADLFMRKNGLPCEDILSVACCDNGKIYLATREGLFFGGNDTWLPVAGFEKGCDLVTARNGTAVAVTAEGLFELKNDRGILLGGLPSSLSSGASLTSLCIRKSVFLGTSQGLYIFKEGSFRLEEALNRLLDSEKDEIRQTDFSVQNELVVAARSGLYSKKREESWKRLFPIESRKSWSPIDVRGAVFDDQDRLWFASPQGVGFRHNDLWTLFTPEEGLPFDDFTTLCCSSGGVVWFGTTKGAIRYDGNTWDYRQGMRWIPDDHVRAIQMDQNRNIWIATPHGISHLISKESTLAEKAAFFEDEIDRYHRRTPFGYVYSVRLNSPGGKNDFTHMDSDNDGLWTSMYGAAECFAYGATGNSKAKERGKAAFAAMNFLREVTQAGSHPAPPGFLARTVLPTSGPNPNEGRLDADTRKQQEGDHLWKVISPRWPVSEDGQWYWKTDTSSDELDGHFFFYGLYYDLIAETEEERGEVEYHVRAIADHLIEHDYQLVDHDGLPTRWARFSPKEMNFSKDWWEARGLNAMSILSYLSTAEHICKSGKYKDASDELVNNHGYGIHLMYPKHQYGMGSGNQSDDEMAFMDYYNLIKYTHNDELRQLASLSLSHYWEYIQPELNPFFNMVWAASCTGSVFEDTWAKRDLSPSDSTWLSDAVDTLKRMPMNRVRWPIQNSHRKDILFLPHYAQGDGRRKRGYRRCGKVLPVDERNVEHWNHDPWQLDCEGNGQTLCDGTVFLLPYYMGLYHGFIRES